MLQVLLTDGLRCATAPQSPPPALIISHIPNILPLYTISNVVREYLSFGGRMVHFKADGVHGLGFSGGFTGALNALRVFSSVVRLFFSEFFG